MMLNWLRPELLWLVIPTLLLLIAHFVYQRVVKQQKTQLIANHLASFVMQKSEPAKRLSFWWCYAFCILAIIAAAGPSWQKEAIPVYQTKYARVIVMDMSLSMYSQDIKPNRLTQARFKMLDLIEQYKDGETALIAYSGDAFVISPLTSDHQTIANLLPSLEPDIMPSKGSNPYAALNLAFDLLKQANYSQGEILLVTDGIDSQDLSDLTDALEDAPYTLNIYAVATEQGAPIQLPQQGFLKDSRGNIVIPKANYAQLKPLAARSGGRFTTYQSDDSDITYLAQSPLDNSEFSKSDEASEQAIDGGIYFVILLLPLALLMFRSNALFIVPLFILAVPSQPVYAFSLPDFLQNKQQKALQAYQAEAFEKATESDNAMLSGAAYYQLQQYDKALSLFERDNSAIGLYNQGNALAHLNDIEQAISRYEAALKLRPDFEQAQHNLDLLKQQQSQQQQSEQQKQSNEQQDSEQNSEQNQQQDQSQQSDQNNAQSSQQQDANKGDQKDESQQANMEADAKQKQSDKTQPQPAQQQPNEMAEQQNQAQQSQMSEVNAEDLTDEEKEKAQMLNQLLRKVPDQPSILLRNKMLLESRKRTRQRQPQGSNESW